MSYFCPGLSGYYEGMFLSPFQVVDQLPIRPGMRVADFGSGNGQYSLLLAERLRGEGSVYAFDLNEEGVESLARERLRKNIADLYTMCVDLNSHLPLKDAMLHCALISNTMYALQERDIFLAELKRVLADGGTVYFTDWASSFKNMGPRDEEVITPSEAVRIFEQNGFTVGPMLPAGSHHYAFIATKR